MNLDEIFEHYIINDIEDWDPFEVWDKEDLKDILKLKNIEYSNEDFCGLYDMLLNFQEQQKARIKEQDIKDFEQEIRDTIYNSGNIFSLNYSDIGKILVKIASNYFEWE